MAEIQAMQAQEQAETVNPLCESKVMGHGARTQRVVVFVHGFTNCPEQFEVLGQQFYDAGYNVFIPRMPHHGLSDRLTTELSKLSTEALVAFGGDVVDIAQGLGDEVTVVGLSGGGAVTAWLRRRAAT
ncbi:MAG: alpha/beta fold hydrolase [Caldilineaceae bacterium]